MDHFLDSVRFQVPQQRIELLGRPETRDELGLGAIEQFLERCGLRDVRLHRDGTSACLLDRVNGRLRGFDIDVAHRHQFEIVGIGDAENDEAFLQACGVGVAVSNALPSLKQLADFVTIGARGAGVAELIDRVIAGDIVALRTPPA